MKIFDFCLNTQGYEGILFAKENDGGITINVYDHDQSQSIKIPLNRLSEFRETLYEVFGEINQEFYEKYI